MPPHRLPENAADSALNCLKKQQQRV